ncbi:hypothetical protein FRC03_006492 [Tulasnella sp. 419]|nr:hypothetical protein FRC03_006492 [Tulasnella sp. 419]
MARPYFDRERISDYKTFHKYTEKIIHRLDCLSAADETVDVQDLFGRFSLDTAGEFLFGFSDFNSLEFPLPKLEERFEDSYYGFARALGEARENVMRRVRIGQHAWTILEFFKDSQSQPMSVIDSWLNPWIERALARKGCSVPENSCFLEHLISSTKDTQLIKDQLLNILMAARDTTAETLTFASYALCQHPNVMARLRKDILENLGPTTVPTYEDLKGLKYLRAVINEVLRLFPPIPINTRTSLSPCVVPTNDPKGPFFVPSSGTQIIFSIISYQRRKDLWGDDADEFDPERWLDKRVKLMATDPSKFMPFGAGPR